jgi:putative DNA primase/helicase
MSEHLGIEDTPLHRAYSARFLISMIARVREPGCKVDTVPIFEGPQGLQRSSLLQALAEPWFTDHVPNLDTKDAQLQLHGVWLVEFAEYGNLGKADASRAKNFITTQVDRLRKPYGEVVEEMRRQSVMAVTLNPEAHPYLKDATGNRRLWPVLCGATWEPGRLVNLEAFRRERLQLLAEADHRYRQGEWWWLHEPDLIEAHRESVIERVDGGPLLESVSRAVHAVVEKDEDLTFRAICTEMGLLSVKDLTLAVQRNIGQAMTLLGYRGERRQKDDVRQMFYLLI